MKINSDILNYFFFLGIVDVDQKGEMDENKYYGRLNELKFELEDALGICENEIRSLEASREPPF